MVYYFTTVDVDTQKEYVIYMGKHKVENEDLLRNGWPEDIWFHLENFSSAHLYLRLTKGQTIDDIPSSVLEDCCQLVKANSIHGYKVDDVTVNYTPWNNLFKTNGMEPGEVGFHSNFMVKKFTVKTKKKEVVDRLNKTKVEMYPDLAGERKERDRKESEDANNLELE